MQLQTSLAILVLALLPNPVSATTREPSAQADSPQSALVRFLELNRRGLHGQTLDLLDPLAPPALRNAETARKLAIVLDQDQVFRADLASNVPQGLTTDDPNPLVEQVRAAQPVSLRRMGPQDSAGWVFDTATLNRVDGWYASLDNSWVHEHLPPWLTGPGPRGLAWWQWLALPLLALLAFLLARPAAWLVLAVLRSVAARTEGTWDDQLVQRARGPVVLLGTVLLALLMLPWLRLGAGAHHFLSSVLLGAGVPAALAWSVLRSVDVLMDTLRRSPWLEGRAEAKALLPMVGRILKVVLGAAVLMAVLQALGYPVTSVVAGLGIGGLVVALAAQKTMENFFGSIALSVDQPFHPGDFIKVDDCLGTVESVGLRSTRIRTLDRTLVSIPNGKLADGRLENFSVRDRFHFYCLLGLGLDTRPHQVRAIVADMVATLKAHPLLWPDDMVVCLKQVGTSSMDVEVRAWFTVAAFAEFAPIRQKMLLELLEVVERHGSSLAYPTQTIHLATPSSPWCPPRDTETLAPRSGTE